jgi:hypothetical protein
MSAKNLSDKRGGFAETIAGTVARTHSHGLCLFRSQYQQNATNE